MITTTICGQAGGAEAEAGTLGEHIHLYVEHLQRAGYSVETATIP